MKHAELLIIGAGTAGIMTAAQMMRRRPRTKIAVIDPAEFHYYQPAWTLVGAGAYRFEKTRRPIRSLIPRGVEWIRDAVTAFDPASRCVSLQSGEKVSYDFLVVAPGLVTDLTLIDGLADALGKGVVCSNYTNPLHTWEVLRRFSGGNAVFTSPTTPVKCGGATQKIAYLAADFLRKKKPAAPYRIVLATPGSVIFGIKPIAETLTKVIARYGIHLKLHYVPVKVDGANRKVTFRQVRPGPASSVIDEPNPAGEYAVGSPEERLVELEFSMLHIAPPQTAPACVRNSPLAGEKGWLDVDPFTLQHNRYPNVFGLGDVADLPTAKTGAAVRKQAPVVVDNLVRLMDSGKVGDLRYNGYSSCPLVTAYGKMVLAEFDYGNHFTPDPKLKHMLIRDSSRESWRLWILKRHLLPWLYWNRMMKGREV